VNESDLDAEDFLELLWGDEECWVELPAKVNGYWVPYQLDWPPSRDTAVSLRIDQCLRDEEDLYYSVARFREKGRNIEHVLPTEWLWADLDTVHPTTATKMGLMPTIAVESSPGRYQALWRLTRRLKPRDTEKVNKGLTYALGADRGGWDLTQVLRIPDTRNFKYPGAPRVRMLWYKEENVYDPNEVWRMVKEVVPAAELVGATDVVLPSRPIPHSVERLLWSKDAVKGERSEVRWKIETSLAEVGCTEEEIYNMVVNSAWNSFAERGPTVGKRELTREVHKAVLEVKRKVREKKMEQAVKADSEGQDAPHGDGANRLPFIKYSSYMTMRIKEPKWLIQDFWVAGSHGVLGGEPKTGKTTLALAMALSVSSGKPFLGKYEVGEQGPVMFIQEENSQGMLQGWMRKLSVYQGIVDEQDVRVRRAGAGALSKTALEVDMPTDVPLHMLDNWGFDLSVDEHWNLLQGYIEEIDPVLVILDPLDFIFGPIDINSSAQIQPIVRRIRKLSHAYNCAVMVIHHMHKQSQNTTGRRAGQRLAGSFAIHSFVDSGLYATRLPPLVDGWSRISIEPEFRQVEPQKAIEIAWHFGQGTDVEFKVGAPQDDVGDKILEAMGSHRKRISLQDARDAAGVHAQTIARHVRKDARLRLAQSGRGNTTYIYRVSSNGTS